MAWSRTTRLFLHLSGMLDPRRGRGFYNSFHAGIPLLRFPLAHVFHTNDFGLIGLRLLEHVGSDHFRRGGVQLGTGWVVENCVVEWTNAAGPRSRVTTHW